MKYWLAPVITLVLLLAGCSGPSSTNLPGSAAGASTPTGAGTTSGLPSPTWTIAPTSTPALETTLAQETPISSASVITNSCGLSPILVPTMAPNPGMDALDATTGLHVTGQAVQIDLASYRLQVTGLVDHPLSLSYDDLRCMPKVTADLTLICPQVFEDRATWSGVQLKYVLGLAGVQNGATVINMIAADKDERQMYLQDALKDGNFLAYEWNGQPLPILHGFPLRAVFPSMPGYNWVKWLLEIQVK